MRDRRFGARRPSCWARLICKQLQERQWQRAASDCRPRADDIGRSLRK